MSINSRARRAIAAASGAALVASTASACFAEPSAMPTVRDFLIAWQVGNYKAAANLTTGADRRQVEQALGQVRAQLDAASMRLELGTPVRSGEKTAEAITKKGDTAEAKFSVKFDLGENGQPWTYSSGMRLKRIGGKWKVVWDTSIIHRQLRNGHRLAVVSTVAPRGQIYNATNRSLLSQVPAVVAGVYPGQLADPKKTLDRLARVTRQDGGQRLDVERLLGRVRSAPPEKFLSLLTLQQQQNQALIQRLRSDVPGLHVQLRRLPIGSVAAPEVIGTLGPATADRLQQVGAPYQPGDTIGINGLQLSQQRRLAGTPTVQVVAQDPQGRDTQTLASWQGVEPKPIRTTLNNRLQENAERTLADLRFPASLVAIQSSTGAVQAVSNRGTDGRNAAFEAEYPPGLAFGIVSAEALLRNGMTDAAKTECPATVNVGGQTFQNPGPPRNQQSFQQNFGASCATTLAGLSTRVSAASLAQSVERFGFGKDWGLGLSAFTGSVPTPANDAEKAATMIGQGRVRMSPLAMAAVAAAVDAGLWRPPYLVADPPRGPEAPQSQALDAAVVDGLTKLMRRSVFSGTAKDAKVSVTGAVYGVVATVDYQDKGQNKTVSWFVGAREGTAFAIAIEGRTNAAKVAASFLRGGTPSRTTTPTQPPNGQPTNPTRPPNGTPTGTPTGTSPTQPR
ncbi:penicillin-binding transpeptidase domain-containing protein [Actinomadura kijaniata]|uniref:penicillin-binding transpeptidase domain-containing protein n=1 Tax=Actinomadura kijaniata TaxID=46161 RepID=UPI000B270BEC|nr:penicillin-binding transpeptidase domain-containing protein [Actinomadura kijaniata]